MEHDERFSYHVVRYEDFATDNRGIVQGLLRFFGHNVEPILVPINSVSGKIDVATHFRRGQPGCHRDEASPDQTAQMTSWLDRNLFERMERAI